MAENVQRFTIVVDYNLSLKKRLERAKLGKAQEQAQKLEIMGRGKVERECAVLTRADARPHGGIWPVTMGADEPTGH
jgi:hypothetical protein